jgi:hypothetical protein
VIPKDFITEWRERAPWVLDRQVEQDLVISRALVELFSRGPIANTLAFRGGTALYKLHLRPPARYSQDIDLVQTSPGGIGEVLDAIHDALDPWLGEPKWKQTEGLRSQAPPPTPRRQLVRHDASSRLDFGTRRTADSHSHLLCSSLPRA